VEEVKIAMAASSVLLLIPPLSFSSVIKPVKGGQAQKIVRSDKEERFDFGSVPAGARLSMKWPDKNGNLTGPISNSYPIAIVSSKDRTNCQRPLWVAVLSGSESGITVSFGSEKK
jgi:hypothetical protein